MSKDDTLTRRSSLLMLGFGAVGFATLQSAPASAQPRGTAVNSATLQLKLSDPRAVKELGLSRRLPASTPITGMLSSSGAASLSPAARTLTKADLVSMSSGRITPAAAKLSVRDVQSIQAAFRAPTNLAANDISACCCCTPCCCAAAVEPGIAAAA